MLSLLKLILAVALVVVLVSIGVQNNDGIDLSLQPIRQLPFRLPLSLALLYAYVAGLLTFGLVHLFQDLKLRSQISRLKKENRKVSEELHQLRSITLEGLPGEDETEVRP